MPRDHLPEATKPMLNLVSWVPLNTWSQTFQFALLPDMHISLCTTACYSSTPPAQSHRFTPLATHWNPPHAHSAHGVSRVTPLRATTIPSCPSRTPLLRGSLLRASPRSALKTSPPRPVPSFNPQLTRPHTDLGDPWPSSTSAFA